MPHFTHNSRVWRSFCRVIDSLSELIANYMAVTSVKSPTLDLTGSGRSFIYIYIYIRSYKEEHGSLDIYNGLSQVYCIKQEDTPFVHKMFNKTQRKGLFASLLTVVLS